MSSSHEHFISIEAREILCSSLISIIFTSLPDGWSASLDTLAQPILSSLDNITKEADLACSNVAEKDDAVDKLLTRLSNEIHLLGETVKCFVQEGDARSIALSKESRATMFAHYRDPVVSLMHTCWPGLTHIAKNYGSIDVSN
jgi:hypothetical protein